MTREDDQQEPSQATSPPVLVEYALVLVLIAIAVIGSLTLLGGKISNIFSTINSGLNPPTTQTTALSEIIDNEIKNLVKGQILFNPPKEMRVGVEERVEARITKLITEDLSVDLNGRGEPITRTLSTGTFMTVVLTGGNAFDVKNLTSSGQIVGGEGFTEWAWNVTPLKSGTRILTLVATVRIKLPDGKEEVKDLPVFDEPIEVKVNPLFTVGKFIDNYWQWLATGILLPIIAFFVKRYLDRKKPESTEQHITAQTDTSATIQTRNQNRDRGAKRRSKR